jgi:type VI secretion system protein ImpA
MAIDIAALVAPLSEEKPAGEDLSYDPVRQEIEAAFDRSISDADAGQADIDWPQIIRLIIEQCAQTRDVWLAVYLMRAGARAGRFETVEDGAALLAELLEKQWDHVHPQIEEYGFQGRKGASESLARYSEFLSPFRKVMLIEHPRLGSYSGADFKRFHEGGDSEDGYGMFRALLEETPDEDLQALVDRIQSITAAIRRADAVLTANAGDDTGTNFQPTYDAISEIVAAVRVFMRAASAESGETAGSAAAGDQDAGENSGDSGRGEAGGASLGAINSRDDVLRAIDAINSYYARREPGSPVPFALRRARDWVSLSFLEVLEDIVPNSLDDARRVLMNGRNRESSDSW